MTSTVTYVREMYSLLAGGYVISLVDYSDFSGESERSHWWGVCGLQVIADSVNAIR